MSVISKHKTYMDNHDPYYNEERTYIYLLLDPRDDVPFYVGKAKDVIKRLGAHLQVNTGNLMGVKMNELRRLMLIPKVQILERVDGDGTESEKKWILLYADVYPNLCNYAYNRKKSKRK